MDDKEIQQEYAQLLAQWKNDESFITQLDQFYTDHASEISKELNIRIASTKATVLVKMKRYAEALEIMESIENEVEKKGLAYFNIIYDLALTNFKLGNKERAIAIIEDFLQLSFPQKEFMNLNMLRLLVEVQGEKPVAAKYNNLLEAIGKILGINLPQEENLNLKIKELSDRNRQSNVNYSKLLLEIEDLDQKDKIAKLEEFAANEQELSFYKNMAKGKRPF